MAEPNLKLDKIGVVMLGVSDIQRSIPFYRDQLGLTLQGAFEGFAFFAAGGVTLALNTGVWKALGERPGATEVVFAVPNVKAAHADLSRRGISFTHAPRPITPTDWGANFRDPDGHALSLFGPPGD